jgi:predicted RNase H-like HicB family nuclease
VTRVATPHTFRLCRDASAKAKTVKEALANIYQAIGLYLEPTEDDLVSSEHALVEEIEL